LLGNTEVEDFNENFAILIEQEDVIWFQISVNYPRNVSLSERFTCLGENPGNFKRVKGSYPLNSLPQVFSFQQLHYNVGQGAFYNPMIKDLHHVRTFNPGCSSGFATKASNGRSISSQRYRHKLDGDLRMQCQMVGNPNRTHPAFPKQAYQTHVWRDHLTGG